MKKIVAIALLLFTFQTVAINTTFAQKLKPAEVPESVTQAMDFQYPYVKVTAWQLENNTYIATFKDDGATGKAHISADGKWLRTTYDVKRDELPSVITEYVKANYPEFIIDVSCLEEKGDESLCYYLEVKEDGIGFKPSKLYFSNAGKLLSRKDPEGFNDPLAPKPDKTATQKPVKKDDAKPVATKPTTAKGGKDVKTATAKPAAKPTAKPAAKASAKPADTKSTTKPAAKPAPQKPSPTAGKKEKTDNNKKKEKEEPVIKDEFGNVALKESTIPDAVKKGLAKKVMHPEELHWFNIDNAYVAKCINTGKKTSVYLTKEGVWTKTLTSLPEESVTGPMLKHLNDYYKGFKFKSALKEHRADKNDKTMVEFYEKANYKNKLVTTVIFDKTGKLIRTIDAEPLPEVVKEESAEDADLERYYKKMNMSLDDNGADRIPENIRAVFKLKYPRITNVEWKENGDMNYEAHYYSARGKEICVINSLGTVVETMVQGKPDNLSSAIQDYIKKEHKNTKVTDFYTVKRVADKLTLYKVIIQDKKTKEESELWFSMSGKPFNM